MRKYKKQQNIMDAEQTRLAFFRDKLIPSEYTSLFEQDLWAQRLLSYCPKQAFKRSIISKKEAVALYSEAMTEHIRCFPTDRFGVGRAVRAKETAKTTRILPDNPIDRGRFERN